VKMMRRKMRVIRISNRNLRSQWVAQAKRTRL